MLFAFVLSAVGACHDEPVPFEGQVSRSKYFEYHSEVQEELCPELLSLLDQHAEVIGARIGMPLDPNADPFRYYQFRSRHAYTESFPNSGGTSEGDSVYSFLKFDEHELVHAYINRAWGAWPSNGLLREGVAVALSCDPADVCPRGSYDWREILHAHSQSLPYVLAGQFVTYLLRHYGVHRFRQLYLAVSDPGDAADFEAGFARFYPVSMDEAWRSAVSTRPDCLVPFCLRDWNCWTMGPPLDLGNSATKDCSGRIRREMTVSDGYRGIVISKAGLGSLMVWRNCLDDAGPYLYFSGGSTETNVHWVTMDPGVYVLTGRGIDVQLHSYLPTPLLGATCETAGEVKLDDRLATDISFPSITRLDGWIRLAGGEDRSFDFQVSLGFLLHAPEVDPSALTLCESCDPAALCFPLNQTSHPTIPVARGSVLHLQNLSASGGLPNGAGGQGLRFRPLSAGADR